MRADTAPTIRLSDYRPPAFLAEGVELTFALHPTATRVKARVAFRRNPEAAPDADLRLDGRSLKLVSAAIDGIPVPQNALALDDEGLTVAAPHVPDAFTWEAEVEIAPEANTAPRGPLHVRAACTAPSARPRASARSPTSPTAPT